MEGFTHSQSDQVIEAVSRSDGSRLPRSHVEDIVVNNWSLLRENSVATPTLTIYQPDSADLS